MKRLASIVLAGAIASLLAGACSEEESGTPSAPTDAASDGGVSEGGASDATADATSDTEASTTTFTLSTSAFAAGGDIPAAYTCDGAGDSFPLSWSNPPPGTASFAIVMRDLSLGGSGNYHWVLWDIAPTVTALPAAVENVQSPSIPAGSRQSYWSFGAQYGYGNPCPPSGQTHDYQVTVYALQVATIAPGAPDDPVSADGAIQAAAKAGSAALFGKYTKP